MSSSSRTGCAVRRPRFIYRQLVIVTTGIGASTLHLPTTRFTNPFIIQYILYTASCDLLLGQSLDPPVTARLWLFSLPSLELNLNFIAHYSNLHFSALSSFLSQATSLFWQVASPDCITVQEFFDSRVAVWNPDRPHRSGFLDFSALGRNGGCVIFYRHTFAKLFCILYTFADPVLALTLAIGQKP